MPSPASPADESLSGNAPLRLLPEGELAIARRFNAGPAGQTNRVPEGRLKESPAAPAVPPGLDGIRLQPGVETPGYFYPSLRDFRAAHQSAEIFRQSLSVLCSSVVRSVLPLPNCGWPSTQPRFCRGLERRSQAPALGSIRGHPRLPVPASFKLKFFTQPVGL